MARRYFPALFEKQTPGEESKFTRGITVTENRVPVRLYERPDYSPVEVAELCEWLNEREQGYPALVVMPLEWTGEHYLLPS